MRLGYRLGLSVVVSTILMCGSINAAANCSPCDKNTVVVRSKGVLLGLKKIPKNRMKALRKTILKDFKKRAKKKGTRRAKKSAKRVVRKKKTAKRGTVKKAPAPKLGDVITQILTQAKRPLNLDEIVAGIQKKGVTMRSKNPKHALGVKMYRDKKFKKARPGYFTVR